MKLLKIGPNHFFCVHPGVLGSTNHSIKNEWKVSNGVIITLKALETVAVLFTFSSVIQNFFLHFSSSPFLILSIDRKACQKYNNNSISTLKFTKPKKNTIFFSQIHWSIGDTKWIDRRCRTAWGPTFIWHEMKTIKKRNSLFIRRSNYMHTHTSAVHSFRFWKCAVRIKF